MAIMPFASEVCQPGREQSRKFIREACEQNGGRVFNLRGTPSDKCGKALTPRLAKKGLINLVFI